MKRLILALCLLATPAFTQPLKLDAKTQARLQIRTAPLQPAHAADAVQGFAAVVDPTPLLTLLSDLAAAQSAYNASAAEAARTQALARDATVATRTAEAADAQAHGDQAKVTLLQQRVALEWGPYFAGLNDAQLRQLSSDLAAGRAALVRIDTPLGQGLRGARSAMLDAGALGIIPARVLGVARTADPRLQSPGLITLVTGADAAYLSVGLTCKAQLYGGGATDGVLIPNDALLRRDGRVFAYVRTGAQVFTRREVTPSKITADGIIVTSGFAAGDTVVVQGAAALQAAETPKTESDD
ncbi:MAG: hypothetical protein JF615_04715 [Asticcacaulis sp.]|nr:hypothetical protein [Asticcacaulis sp.]